MTVLMSESQLLGTGRPPLPRVNLLPPEIAEARAFRRVQLGLGAGLLASVAVVGLLYLQASHSVSSAQSDLDAATSQQTQLQGEITKYRGVTALYAAADAAQAQQVVAMGDEVQYSQVLTDLSLTIPSNVWLTSITYTQTPPAAPTATKGVVVQPVVGPQPIGTATFNGVGFSHDDVASWLDAIAGLKAYANPYFSNSTEALIGTRPTVNFTSTAVLLSTAESGRYNRTGS